jgi:hypothetical protein
MCVVWTAAGKRVVSIMLLAARHGVAGVVDAVSGERVVSVVSVVGAADGVGVLQINELGVKELRRSRRDLHRSWKPL